ncbi:Radial spoke head 14 [Chytridiales sp. JEL 0842]|nr:Radial spoke head 14 [Chytridiales sp. JEL 0842]
MIASDDVLDTNLVAFEALDDIDAINTDDTEHSQTSLKASKLAKKNAQPKSTQQEADPTTDDNHTAPAPAPTTAVTLRNTNTNSDSSSKPSSSSSPLWSFPHTAGFIPAPRVGASLTFVPHKNSCFLFGGASHEDGFKNDLYTLNASTGIWTFLSPNGARPTPRYEHAMALVHRKSSEPSTELKPTLLLFGGASEECLLNDLWALDIGKMPIPASRKTRHDH